MTRGLLSVVLVLTAAASARGQDFVIPARLTLDDAIRLAAERNPSFAAARNAIDIAEAQRLDARLRPNPAASFESVGRPPGATPPSLDDHEYVFRVDQEIETAGRRRLRTHASEAAIAVAQGEVDDARRRLDLDVRRSYFAVVLAKTDLEVARASLDEIDRVIVLNRARHEQGEISGGELRRIQVERLRFVDDSFAAELALRNARSTLLALFNANDLGVAFDVVETLNPADSPAQGVPALSALPAAVDPASLRAQALSSRPDLLAAQRDVQRADTETRLQRALRTPNITFGGGYSHLGGLNTVAFGVTVPLPIFNRNPGGIARAEAERRQAANRAAATATNVLLDVQQAINAVDVARARVEYIEREYLTPARESRDIVLAAYRLGSADLIDFLDAQRAFRDTLRTYNRALYERRVSAFQLAAATGVGATSTQVKP